MSVYTHLHHSLQEIKCNKHNFSKSLLNVLSGTAFTKMCTLKLLVEFWYQWTIVKLVLLSLLICWLVSHSNCDHVAQLVCQLVCAWSFISNNNCYISCVLCLSADSNTREVSILKLILVYRVKQSRFSQWFD